MHTRPLALTLFSTLLICIGLSIPIQNADLENFRNIPQTVSVLNGIVAFLCVATALAIYHVHKSFILLVPLTYIMVVFSNWWAGTTVFDISSSETAIISLGFAGLGFILLDKNSLNLLRNPKLKWWNVPARKKVGISVSLSRLRGGALLKKAFDISKSGIFIQMQESDDYRHFHVGEKIDLNLHFNQILKVRCEAMIVRKSPPHGNYPAGLGLQFIDKNVVGRSTLKKLIGEIEPQA